MPRFSIVMPCFNAAATLSATLDSIARQSFHDWELICVDDGSTDASRLLLAERAARDPRIIPVCNPGKGPSDARNYGALSIAQGQIIAFCDADDIWLPNKLAELDRAFADHQLDAAFGQIAFFDGTPDRVRVTSTVPEGPVSIAMLLGENPVCTMSNLSLRTEAFRATGGFATDMVHNEDLEWLIRLVGNGARLQGQDSLQVWYRASAGGLSSDLDAMRAGRERAIATARRFGVSPDTRAEAIHLRYLARRALRLDHDPREALGLVVTGIRNDPTGFLLPLRRGGATAVAACLAPLLPCTLRRALFAR
ncbi:glycosyltransferase family 2 protein [Seohaeicola saemankumensis]|nr:glycosyltransferase family A protein [Seohaeicola saemankumensis]MCA0872930.1 glycosyltransferase family 2 protein [Seohaeicola saemankumensis]